MTLFSRDNPHLPLNVFATRFDGDNSAYILANYPGCTYTNGTLKDFDGSIISRGDYIYRSSVGSVAKKCDRILFEETYN